MPAEDGASGNAGGDDSSSPKDKRTQGMNKTYQGRYGFQRPTVKQPKFEGKCDNIKGHIYDCTDSRQSDMFVKTTREVGEFVGRTYKYGGDMRLTVENLERIDFAQPTDPPNNQRGPRNGFGKRRWMNLSSEKATMKKTSKLYTP